MITNRSGEPEATGKPEQVVSDFFVRYPGSQSRSLLWEWFRLTATGDNFRDERELLRFAEFFDSLNAVLPAARLLLPGYQAGGSS
jgi:hypothetical protein